MNDGFSFCSSIAGYFSDVSGKTWKQIERGSKMSAISLKSFVVTAALGVAAIFTTAATASAASPVAVPAVSTSAGSTIVNVDYRGHRHGRPVYRGPACSVEGAAMRVSSIAASRFRFAASATVAPQVSYLRMYAAARSFAKPALNFKSPGLRNQAGAFRCRQAKKRGAGAPLPVWSSTGRYSLISKTTLTETL